MRMGLAAEMNRTSAKDLALYYILYLNQLFVFYVSKEENLNIAEKIDQSIGAAVNSYTDCDNRKPVEGILTGNVLWKHAEEGPGKEIEETDSTELESITK